MIPFSNEYLLQYMATLNNKDYVDGIDEMEGKTTKMGKSATGLGKKIKGLVTPTNAAAAAFAYMSYRTVQAVKDFASYEKQLSKVNTLLKVSRKELRDYGDGFIDLAIKTGKVKEEIADGAYQALSAGVSKEGLASFMEIATKGAIAGFTDVNTAVDGVTTVLNAYNLEVTEAGRVTDLLLTIQKNGKTTLGEMSQYLANVIPIAAAMNIEFEEVAAAMAQLTAQGTPTAQATTQIRAAISELSKEGQQANKTFTKITGKTFPDFIKEGGSLNEALQLMEKYAKDNNKSMVDLWGSIEAGQGALGLTGENAEGFTENLKDMNKAAGELEKAYKLATDNISTEWKKLTAAMGKEWMLLVKDLEKPIKVTLEVATNFLGERAERRNTRNQKKDFAKLWRAEVDRLMKEEGLYGAEARDQARVNVENSIAQGKQSDYYQAYNDAMVGSSKGINKGSGNGGGSGKGATQEETNKAIEEEKKRHTQAMQDIDIKYLKTEKDNLVELNSQLESGAITREEYDKRLEDSQKASTEAQKMEYMEALKETQRFYEGLGMIAEANALEKQILEIEVQLNGLDTLEGIGNLFEEQKIARENFNKELVAIESAFQYEMYNLKEAGQITEGDLERRRMDHKVSMAELENQFDIDQLIQQRDFYAVELGDMEKALEIQEEIFKKEAKQKKDNLELEKLYEKTKLAIKDAAESGVKASYKAMITGEKNAVEALEEIGREKLATFLMNEGAERAWQATVDFGKGLSYMAAQQYPAAKEAFYSSAMNASIAATMGVAAKAAMPSGGGGEDSKSDNHYKSPEEHTNEIVKSSEESKSSTLYVSVEDSEMAKAMVKHIEKELNDGYNASIIAQKKN